MIVKLVSFRREYAYSTQSGEWFENCGGLNLKLEVQSSAQQAPLNTLK